MVSVLIYFSIALIGTVLAVPVYGFFTKEQEKRTKISFRKDYVAIILFAVGNVLYFCFTFTLVSDTWVSILTNAQNQLLWCIVFLIAAIDFKVMKIPNKLVLGLLIVRALYMIVVIASGAVAWKVILVNSLVGFVAGAIFMGVCYFFARGGVGAGDLKLYASLGFCYELVGLVAIMLYSLLASVVVGVGMLVFKKAKFKTAIPMAPFIIFGLTIYLVFAN